MATPWQLPTNRLPTEHEEQRDFVLWFRQTFTGVRIFAIPNGGYRGKGQALKLKAEGVSPGVPDLYVPEWKLWIEMKRQKGGAVSPEQKDWHAYLRSTGDTVIVARGSAEAQRLVLELQSQLSQQQDTRPST